MLETPLSFQYSVVFIYLKSKLCAIIRITLDLHLDAFQFYNFLELHEFIFFQKMNDHLKEVLGLQGTDGF
jgi:hypothetical protein